MLVRFTPASLCGSGGCGRRITAILYSVKLRKDWPIIGLWCIQKEGKTERFYLSSSEAFLRKAGIS